MDIIIALTKQSCYFNNQIKLIIVSATMDDDEPIYRSYFKIINDKLVYPIKSRIKNPFFPNEMLLLNPINMDRRYHISPPGETTQYKVTEIYSEDDNDNGNNKESAKKIQELGYEKVIEICNKSTTGEMLFFCTGENEILQAVEYLNKNMPPGNIALPFFSNMNQIYKDIITKINSKIYNIKNRRENIHLEWTKNYIEDPSVPAGLYKRSVIIATNVAEASVTIPGLAYVIDNGYAKENTFNRSLNISKLIVDKISESSRLQRKGRVGRVSDGTVYYMYKKEGRKEVKPKYKITQQDIAETVLGLTNNLELNEYLKDPINYKYSKLIVSEIINPNIFGNYPKYK
jgi:HrpA-like RNA helicase